MWAVAFTVVLGCTVPTGIVALRYEANDRTRAQLLLGELTAETHRARAAEWRAVAHFGAARRSSDDDGRRTTSENAWAGEIARDAMRRAHVALGTVVEQRRRGDTSDAAALRPLRDALVGYDAALGDKLLRIADGRTSHAELVRQTSADPRYATLRDATGAATIAFDADAKRAERIATFGTLALVLLAGCTTAGIGHLYGRARFHGERAAGERRAAAATEARFRSLVEHATDLMMVVRDGVITYASPSAAQTLGVPESALIGTLLSAIVHPDDAAATAAFAAGDDVGGGPVWHLPAWRLRHADGGWLAVEAVRSDLRGNAAVAGVVLDMRDVSERTQLRERLTHLAFRDSLTGLVNRTLFLDRTDRALARSVRTADGPEQVSVLLLDVDDFRTVNDSLGHAAGDAVLVEVAARLLAATRAADTVGRLGGDEFGVLLEHAQTAEDAAATARRMLDALAAPIDLHGTAVTIGASVGVARARPEDGPDDLLRNADLAMSLAKRDGRQHIEVFAPVMHAVAQERVALEIDLRRALDRGELRLAYQPIVTIGTLTAIGFEALMRWQHPTRGPVPPAVFIPIAEQTGAIVALGRWALMEACRQAAEWGRTMEVVRAARGAAAPAQPLLMSVNVSGRQMHEGDGLVADVRAALAASGLPAACLQLEVTESVIMYDTDSALAVLRQLRAVGVRVAIDDFGTGYSSLSYLERFPIDTLKIDKAFISGSGAGGDESPLAEAIVRIGHTLGLRVVGEGIETAAQAARLASFGCDEGQGYLFSRPLRPEDAAELVRHELLVAAPARPA